MTHKPCQSCKRYGYEWVTVCDIETHCEKNLSVTAPHGEKVVEGDDWTCVLCLREGENHRDPTEAQESVDRPNDHLFEFIE